MFHGKHTIRLVFVYSFLCFLTLIPIEVEGQTTPSIQGRVVAPGNPGITVELANTEFKTTTDASGTYKFFNLPPGKYTVVAWKPGLAADQKTDISFQGQTVTVSDIFLLSSPKGIKGGLLVEDVRRDQLWISTDDRIIDNVLKDFQAPWGWVGGVVVKDLTKEHKFFFHPATISVAEVTIEAIQTSIEQIRANPDQFAGGFWVIGANRRRYLSLRTTQDQEILIFAHMADGRFSDLTFKTSFILHNTASSPSSGAIEFFGSDGRPLALTIGGETRSRFRFSLTPRGMLKLETSGGGEPKIGWARVTSDQTISGLEKFALHNASGNLISEVEVGPSPWFLDPWPNKEFSILVDTVNKDTALAFVRKYLGEVTLKLIDVSGNEVATKSIAFPPGLPGIWHTTKFITEIFGDFPGIRGFEGSVRIGGAMTAMGLKANGLQFTSVPVVPIE